MLDSDGQLPPRSRHHQVDLSTTVTSSAGIVADKPPIPTTTVVKSDGDECHAVESVMNRKYATSVTLLATAGTTGFLFWYYRTRGLSEAADFAGVSAVVLAVIALTMGLLAARNVQSAVSAAEKVVSDNTLEGRLDELSASMRKSAQLVQQVSAELDARAATARQLKEEAEAAQAIAALHKEQADAIRKMMDVELANSVRRIRSDSIKIGVASFVAGGGVSFVVTLVVHPIH